MHRIALNLSTRNVLRQLDDRALQSLNWTRFLSSKTLETSHIGSINQKLSNSTNASASKFSSSSGKESWMKILTNAEKVVGYPTSFLNLRYLVSDEMAHFANLLRKLMQTKHPLIKMAERFILSSNDSDSKRSIQVNGLIVLLISKAVGQPLAHNSLNHTDITEGIHNSQRCLAEITEMIYMGTFIHRGILDLNMLDLSEVKEMDQGNKLAVLCGDYLLANACNNLAKLRDTEVVDLMSQVISDISESIFRKKKDLPFLKLWLTNINSNSSSLLANSAKSAMVLVKHSPTLQEAAFKFAIHLDISHKIWSEFMKYNKDKNHLNKNETLFRAVYLDKISSESELDAENILGDCKLLFNEHYSLALKHLKSLEAGSENGDADAIESLESILNVMKNTL